MRPLCKICKKNPCAINYHKEGRTFYRKKCGPCGRLSHQNKRNPAWLYRGYKKKDFCEKCGYRSSHNEQFDVYHVDGNLENCRPSNLKTICANCQRILQKTGAKWRQGDLTPDH